MFLCTIFQKYQPEDSPCVANPAKFTANFFYFIFLPFYLSRLFSYYCCKTPQQGLLYVIIGFLLNQLVAGIWEIVAFSRLFELENCEFTIGYFNLIFYFCYMFHTVCSWLILPICAYHLYLRIKNDVEALNIKIQQIANLPT